ncbi:MAG: GNAT family N-acetyltransferase [Gammaproteobacteria bacterium]|nr:MAG: GNAT family N-acetyltransferase [Gammaproteobacteria bacterium]
MREFRKATAADATAIGALYKELVPNAPVHVLPERINDIALDKNTYLVVCDDENNIVATALVVLCGDVMFTRQPFAIIENVIVSHKFQRAGLGKQLMQHIEAFCLAKDCSKIMLLSGSDNHSAHNFYIAMGYNPNVKTGFVKYRRHFEN